MTDLFTAKSRLKDFLKKRRYWKTSDIIRWGSENFSNRANRDKQQLVEEGFLRRLSDEEIHRGFGVVKESVYECLKYVDKEKRF